MFFTQEDYRKIEKWLTANSRKDTDFVGAATPLKGNETVVLVQDGKNVKTSVKDIVDQFFLLGVSDFLNITDKYGESYISLSQAIQLIPFRSRKVGQVITFIDESGNWAIYQFQGKALNQWNNTTLWIDLLAKISGIPIIDSEDIITKVDNANQVSLYLADKQYNEADYSGLGRIYLRKNIQTIIDPSTGKVINVNLLTQSMLAKENTIYILQYDYNLNNQTITIPEGSVLLFEGGSIDDGAINCNGTTIVDKFSGNATIVGTYSFQDAQADEEDITQNQSSVLKFKDRKFEPDKYSGLGRVILRKNIVEIDDPIYGKVKKNILYQDMIAQSNTIYEIRYDFTLNENITIPANCVLNFEGGSIKNATGNSYKITGTKTKINTDVAYNIFDDTLGDGFELPYIDLRWVGGISDYNENTKVGTDSSFAFERAINAIGQYYNGLYIYLIGQYLLGTTITTIYDLNISGSHNQSRKMMSSPASDISSPSLLAIAANAQFNMIGRGTGATYCNFSIHNIKVIGVDDGSSIFINSTVGNAPGRVSVVEECEFTKLYRVLNLIGNGDTTFGNITISKCVAYINSKFIYVNTTVNQQTVCNLIIKDSNIEQNGSKCIELYKTFGAIIINNNIIEGEPSPIFIEGHNSNIEINNNYFEGNTGVCVTVKNPLGRVHNNLTFNNNFFATKHTVDFYNCYIESNNYDRLSDDSIFTACCILNNESQFKLRWINSYCRFKKYRIGATNFVVALDSNFDGLISTRFSSPLSGASTLSDLVAGSPIYLAFIVSSSDGVNIKIGDGEQSTLYPEYGELVIVKQTPVQSGNAILYFGINSGNIDISAVTRIDNIIDVKPTNINIPLLSTVLSNGTIYRPQGGALTKGYQYYDTSINKPIWWNGTAWVDATGATV